MKSRLNYVNLPSGMKKEIDDMVNQYIKVYRDCITERFISAMLLTLSDCFDFGYKRMNRMLSGFVEIVAGYSDDAYDGVDKKMQKMDDMNRLMREELKSRGIIVSQRPGGGDISIITTRDHTEKMKGVPKNENHPDKP